MNALLGPLRAASLASGGVLLSLRATAEAAWRVLDSLVLFSRGVLTVAERARAKSRMSCTVVAVAEHI